MTSKEFITKTVKQISAGGVRIFPDDFPTAGKTVPVKLPPQTLILGSEFFGSREVLTTGGSLFCHAESLARAKYLVYAAARKNSEISIPVKDEDIESVVKKYEKYLDGILKETEKEYRSLFPEDRDVSPVVNEVFRLLNLKRL